MSYSKNQLFHRRVYLPISKLRLLDLPPNLLHVTSPTNLSGKGKIKRVFLNRTDVI